MRKRGRTVVGFALLGLAVAGISYAYSAFYDYSKPMNGWRFAVAAVSIIVCPTQLVFAGCIDCEVIGWGGFVMYSIIGILNAALYAVIGLVVVSSRK